MLVSLATAQELTLKEFENQLEESVTKSATTKVKEFLDHPLAVESAYANYIFGTAYLDGKYGFTKDEVRAMQYLETSHELGDSNSTYILGITYTMDSSGPLYNANRGYELLEISAEDGHPVAQALSAICYLDTECANQADPKEMKDWFTEERDVFAPQALATLKVATQLPNAKDKFKDLRNVMFQYSSVLQEGNIEPDFSYIPIWFAKEFGTEQVEWWLEVGALEGHNVARITLAAMCYLEVEKCDNKARAMSLLTTVFESNPDIVSEGVYRGLNLTEDSDYLDLLEVMGFYMVGAVNGELNDMVVLNHIFENGAPPLGISAGDPRGENWYNRLKSTPAQELYNGYRAASIVSKMQDSKGQSPGNFLTPTLTFAKQADILFELALEKQFPEAMVTKAVEYLKSENYSSALSLAEDAAYNKHPHANFLLGVIYYEGLGVTKDANKSFKYAERAAKLGHARAQYMTAKKYFTGDGTVQDYYLAFSWANQASAEIEEAKELRTKFEEVFSEDQLHRARMVSSDLRMSLGSN